MINIGDNVEMVQLKLIGQVSAVANNWYTVEIEGEYFGNFKSNELKELGNMNTKGFRLVHGCTELR